MKRKIIIISFLMLLFSVSSWAQSSENPDTICAGSNTYYKIPNPEAGSSFTWGVYQSGGTIQTTTKSDSIRIAWNSTAGKDSIWVFETNGTGCKGDTAKLTIMRVLPPTAEFDNSKLCFGESLNITFTGNPPYNVEYSVNGTSVIKNNITENPYSVGDVLGTYILLHASNKFCGTGTLGSTTNAIIGKELQELQIFHE